MFFFIELEPQATQYERQTLAYLSLSYGKYHARLNQEQVVYLLTTPRSMTKQTRNYEKAYDLTTNGYLENTKNDAK